MIRYGGTQLKSTHAHRIKLLESQQQNRFTIQNNIYLMLYMWSRGVRRGAHEKSSFDSSCKKYLQKNTVSPYKRKQNVFQAATCCLQPET